MTSIYIKVGSRPRNVDTTSSLRDRVLADVRRALLRGEAVTLPGVGRLTVHDGKGYVLTHPDGVTSRSMRGARKVVFQPERSFLRALNEEDSPEPGETGRSGAERAAAFKSDI